MNFGDAVRAARRAAGMAGSALAQAAEIPQSTLYYIERGGNVSSEQKRRLLTALPSISEVHGDRCPFCLREYKTKVTPLCRVIKEEMVRVQMTDNEFLRRWQSRTSRAIMEGRKMALKTHELKTVLAILPELDEEELQKANRTGYRILSRRS